MIEKTVKEIKAALDNRLYFIALMSALALPDICGMAEYPSEFTGSRYKNKSINMLVTENKEISSYYGSNCLFYLYNRSNISEKDF